MGNYFSVNKNNVSVEIEKNNVSVEIEKNNVSVEIEKLELLNLINISIKNKVETLKKYIEKEARLIQELKEHIILLKNKQNCVICKYINKDTIII